MLHRHRRWCVVDVSSAEELAAKLHHTTWCGCAGFRLGSYLLLNDATCADGAQEYAVLKVVPRDNGPLGYRQIESITASWMSEERIVEFLCRLLQGEFDDADWACDLTVVLQAPAEHDNCPHCA